MEGGKIAMRRIQWSGGGRGGVDGGVEEGFGGRGVVPKGESTVLVFIYLDLGDEKREKKKVV